MKIKNRLSLYFSLIGSGVLLVVLTSIYLSFHSFIKDDFYNHLKDRANVAAQLYLEADEITADSLNRVRERYLKSLPSEVIRLYDSRNAAAFIHDEEGHWDSKTIETVRRRGYLEYTDGENQVVGIYYKDNQGNFVILVSALDTDGLRRLDRMLQIILVVFFIVGALLYFVSRIFATQALSPLNDLVKQMQRIKSSHLNVRVNEGNNRDEITELARNFNRLLAHLESDFELQKTYVTNASHELRTPVTSIIGEVELALSKERSKEETERTLQLVLEESERLMDTISGLMELAQVDVDYNSAALTPVRMDELLWEIHDIWNSKLGAGMLKVNIERLPENETLLTVPANRQLMFIALNNLVSNAFKFSGQKQVVCDLYADENLIRIRVADQGIGIPAEDIGKVTASFYRSPNARNFAGNGIGLFVTQKIIQLFNGTLSIQSTEGVGTTITTEFLHNI
ncbi:two-component sensor histidine kinase [Mucilaginibacter sp. PPCGB 2223]|uniref:sensor histidine kinase n=1 Tax=Mucilaginibacter sp. PPCGB 2223 TaxID=1886027 RepID=UPI000824EFF0|nr:ATP-binding protein [Mucilaginibacter sp. PPCGB 2223]OCX52157.1 two-component sensor histidine kinase [Mucilaginibacter sp. PPCGB 2223]